MIDLRSITLAHIPVWVPKKWAQKIEQYSTQTKNFNTVYVCFRTIVFNSQYLLGGGGGMDCYPIYFVVIFLVKKKINQLKTKLQVFS